MDRLGLLGILDIGYACAPVGKHGIFGHVAGIYCQRDYPNCLLWFLHLLLRYYIDWPGMLSRSFSKPTLIFMIRWVINTQFHIQFWFEACLVCSDLTLPLSFEVC
jgi:hypothetical protein